MIFKNTLSVWVILALAGISCAEYSSRLELYWGDETTIDTDQPVPLAKLPTKLRDIIRTDFRGYRLPRNGDYKFDWVDYYDYNKIPFLALGDFNHDGRADIAALLKNEHNDEVWKLVIFHRTNSGFDPVVIFSSPDSDLAGTSRNYRPIQRYGLRAEDECANPPCLTAYAYEAASFVYVWTGAGYSEINTGD